MRVLVIGSGLLGLSTAHYLIRGGAQVTVVDRCAGPALETSYANGSMLTPSMADPWNEPGVLRKLFRWLGREDAPLLLRPRALPSLVGWGLRFLRNSTEARFRDNMRRNLQLALYSVGLMRALRAETGIAYDEDTVGTLKVFRCTAHYQAARRNAEWLARNGVHSIELDAAGTAQLEPALAPVAHRLAGSIHYPDDETGDARRFCEGLADRLCRAGGHLRYGTTVRDWQRKGRRVAAAICDSGRLEADAYVLAAASYSVGLAARLGIRLPIRPVKGYSITLPVAAGSTRPRIAVIDDSLHAAIVPLGSRLRVAGTAEFTGFDLTLRRERIANLLALLREIYPVLHRQLDPSDIEPWAGLRPMSADGVPILGGTPIENLYLNTGHGHLGWTMAAGSGQAVAALILGRSPELPLADYALARY